MCTAPLSTVTAEALGVGVNFLIGVSIVAVLVWTVVGVCLIFSNLRKW